MTGNFASLSSDDFKSIVENPTRAIRLVEFQIDDPTGPAQQVINELRKQINDPDMAAELNEHYKALLKQIEDNAQAGLDADDEWRLGVGTKCLDIDKSWDALNALLMLNEPKDSPLGFILSGGEEIPTEDFGYGPPHGFTVDQTKEIAAGLEKIDPETLANLENLKQLEGQDLYCFSAEEEETTYLQHYLNDLKTFIAAAAKSNQALIVYLA